MHGKFVDHMQQHVSDMRGSGHDTLQTGYKIHSNVRHSETWVCTCSIESKQFGCDM